MSEISFLDNGDTRLNAMRELENGYLFYVSQHPLDRRRRRHLMKYSWRKHQMQTNIMLS